MAYRVTLFEGKPPVLLSKPAFLALSASLLSKYLAESAPRRRSYLEGMLFRLHAPIFRPWLVWDGEDRPDFEQESFFFFRKALESYQPGKGAFVAWVKVYARWARKEYLIEKGRRIPARDVTDWDMPGDPSTWAGMADETVFRLSGLPALAFPDDRILSMRLAGYAMEEVAKAIGIGLPEARARMEAIRGAVGKMELSTPTTRQGIGGKGTGGDPDTGPWGTSPPPTPLSTSSLPLPIGHERSRGRSRKPPSLGA